MTHRPRARTAIARGALSFVVVALINMDVSTRASAAAVVDGGPVALKRELTPADAIATIRVMDNQVLPGEPLGRSAVSPDGTRYVLRLSYGDVARNGVWVDILTGKLDSLASAAKPNTCAHLFTTGLGSPRIDVAGNLDPDPSNLLRWINDHQVAMLWSDAHHIRQALSIDLNTCKTMFLTHSPTHLFNFGIAPDSTLLYDAQAPHDAARSKELIENGFAVSDLSDGWGILQGDMDGSNANDIAVNNAWRLRSPSGAEQPVMIAGRRVDATNPSGRNIIIAPDGRLALIPVGTPDTPPEWDHYASPQLKSLLADNHAIPNRIPLQFVVVDLKTAATHILWSAPKAAHTQTVWSARGNTLLLAPTFLPMADASGVLPPPGTLASPGLAGFAAAEVDALTGAFTVLPVDLTDRVVVSSKWLAADVIKMSTTDATNADPRTQCFQKLANAWQEIGTGSCLCASDRTVLAVHLETRQSLTIPPTILAVGPQGRSRLILDLNPRLLTDFKLGRVERVSGTLSNGLTWIGQLIYPADYLPGTRYPLLIQSLYGKTWGDEEFTLNGTWGGSGMGLGPSIYPAYPGQLLATRNFAVLTLEVLHRSLGVKEPEDYQLAFETAAEEFIASGLADRNKVAIAGFSRNGYWVEFTLAHSKFPFAAAIAADNYDPSYFQAALDDWLSYDSARNGAEPFGPGLQQWILRAPGFNADHMNAPLLKIGQCMGAIPYIIADWEVFSRLRHLHKPVEMYVMPDIDAHPSHNPQNPRQIVAIQTRAIDWLSFWLTGREDPSPQKREQYASWRKMRDSRDSATPSGIPNQPFKSKAIASRK